MFKVWCANMLVLVFCCNSSFAVDNGAFAAEIYPRKKCTEIRKAYHLPAMGIGIILRGIPQEIAVSGLRKIREIEKATIEDKWQIGSCTKSMTATLAAIIINSGRYSLKWETKLKDIFPDIHPDFQDIGLSDLLAHKSGIQDPVDWKGYEEILDLHNLSRSKCDVVDTRSAISEIFLKKQADYNRLEATEAHYSNIGYGIVGAILEKVTGKSWEELMSDHIFTPLEMTSAGFGSPANEHVQTPDQPWGHEQTTNGITPDYHGNEAWMGPAGTVHCSMSDWLKYIQTHIDGYHKRDTNILPASAFQMLQDPMPNNSGMNAGGWMVGEVDGFKVWQAVGSNGSNTATVRVFPSLEAAIIFVTNYEVGEKTDDAFSDVAKWGMDYIQSKGVVLNMEQENIPMVLHEEADRRRTSEDVC